MNAGEQKSALNAGDHRSALDVLNAGGAEAAQEIIEENHDEDLATLMQKFPGELCEATRDGLPQALPLTMPELYRAVSTLAEDQVPLAVGVVLARIFELWNRRVERSEIENLVGQENSGLRLLGARGSLRVGINADPPPVFVDPMDPNDPFPANIWAAVTLEVGRATTERRYWSGGRYGCARALKGELFELQAYSLGQVQHLVQLAITKKILGYQGGALGPYPFSTKARNATMSTKDATMSAKDATMSAKDATMSSKDGSMTRVGPPWRRP